MNILNALKQLRDDIKTWVTNNLNALNAKIDEKTIPIDNKLDSTSVNPVQNQVIAKEIKERWDAGNHDIAKGLHDGETGADGHAQQHTFQNILNIFHT